MRDPTWPLAAGLLVLAAVAAWPSELPSSPAGDLAPAEARAAASSTRALEMPWWSVDGGGGTSSAAGLAITAAVGQPESGMVSACGVTLDGGVWSIAVDLDPVFCDGLETGDTSRWDTVVGATSDSPGNSTSQGAE